MISVNEQSQFKKTQKLFEQFSNKSSPSNTTVEYVKKDGDSTFGIIKEQGSYIIKTSNKKSTKLFANDFEYIGGFGDKKKFQRKTLQEAIKYLHLFINEDKYTLEVPVPPAPTPVAPEPAMPVTDTAPEDSAPIEGEGDATVDGDNPEGDQQKEIQQLTGKLGQDLRQEIQGGEEGGEKFTVGMFKAILAAAKDLSPESKEEVMQKAQEILSPDENAEQQGEQPQDAAPAEGDDAVENPVPQMESVITEDRVNDIKDLHIDRSVDDPEIALKRLEKAFGELPQCLDYKSFADNKHCAVRFITYGKYDAIVLYWATVDIENYDVYIVEQKHAPHFLEDIYSTANTQYIRNQFKDKNFNDIVKPLTQFLSDEEKTMTGKFSLSKEKVEESVFMTKKELLESMGVYKTQV